jgi:hypothetical protein
MTHKSSSLESFMCIRTFNESKTTTPPTTTTKQHIFAVKKCGPCALVYPKQANKNKNFGHKNRFVGRKRIWNGAGQGRHDPWRIFNPPGLTAPGTPWQKKTYHPHALRKLKNEYF